MTLERIETPTTAEAALSSRITVAPYVPGKTLINHIDRYSDEGLPDQFDKSFFGNMSGSSVAQIRAALRYFDLIDENYIPTDLMRMLVSQSEAERKVTLSDLMQVKFADALELSQSATAGQLAKVFNERGISGATVDKAISFYLFMLDYVGIPYSQHFKRRRPSPRRKRPAMKSTTASASSSPAPSSAPTSAPPRRTEEDQKAAYVQMLMDLAKSSDDATLQPALLDRIENALGIGRSATTDPATKEDTHDLL